MEHRNEYSKDAMYKIIKHVERVRDIDFWRNTGIYGITSDDALNGSKEFLLEILAGSVDGKLVMRQTPTDIANPTQYLRTLRTGGGWSPWTTDTGEAAGIATAQALLAIAAKEEAETAQGITEGLKNDVASLYVPYTGATGAVNLGAHDLIVNGISIGLGQGNVLHNTRVGKFALSSNVSSQQNCAFGEETLSQLTSGSTGTNNAFGNATLRALVSGGANNAFGSFTLANVLGSENTGFGDSNLTNLVNANGNIALGIYAGNYYGSPNPGGYLTTSTKSIFIGYNCKALVNGSVNEIVMGNLTVGHGSNTATWGNTSTTNHYFTGAIHADGGLQTFGANDSAGPGYRTVRVPNA